MSFNISEQLSTVNSEHVLVQIVISVQLYAENTAH